MKLKTNIARLLAAGLLLNNIYFYSNANTLDNEIPGRYETLEGEYITIDDSTEGTLEEIEIFGNTVQDENNFNDIQSVGDLYVDKNGKPILDSQGREQYKIDIVSGNKNILSKFLDKKYQTISIDCGWGVVYYASFEGDEYHLYQDVAGHNLTNLLNILNPGTQLLEDKAFLFKDKTYTMSFNAKWNFTTTDFEIRFVDKNNNVVGKIGRMYSGRPIGTTQGENVSFTFTPSEDVYGMFLVLPYGGSFVFDLILSDMIIEEGDSKTNFVAPNQNKTTILLPCQLQKVGDVADRLYWDNEKGRYVIEKNIEKIVIDENMSLKYVRDDNGFSFYNLNIGYSTGNKGDNGRGKIISNWTVNNTITGAGQYYGVETSVTSGGQSDTITISINTDDLNSVGGISQYMMQNPCIIYHARYDWQVVPPTTVYSLKSEIIETNITQKIKVPTYEGKTYIFTETENSINPTLKVKVDRLPQIAKNAIEETENNSTSYNISLARMYVNMLPESLYKDQLQEQLSQVFSSDITLDRESASSNLDVYVKSENMLSISLDTNSVTFEEYSGAEPIEKLNAVNITINSSLPYDLNAYMPTEIINADGTNKLDLDVLNIRESSETSYQTFGNTTDKIVLKSNCVKGNNINHSIDLKLDYSNAHKADVYKTVIKFEAEQK